jgi:hypothetical protein
LKDNNAIVIIHFNPIELYPPIINLINYMTVKMPATKIYLFTNSTDDTISKYQSKSGNISIKRYAVIDQRFSLFRRYWNYFNFYFKSFVSLRKIQPKWVWYFETISALPVTMYFRLKGSRQTKLIIHYHEYISPAEYTNGPAIVKWMHKGEKKLYKIVYSLSQTNEERMQLFLRDNELSLKGKTHILPNYPPKRWINEKIGKGTIEYPVRIVHAGSIGIDSLYIREFCDWVHRQNGRVTFDIYSSQNTDAVRNYISENKYHFIEIKGYVPYELMPSILSDYEIGVILYKGVIPNHIYAVSNKLFEYWACGLDVWFSDKMTGSLQYARTDCYPKLIAVNFTELDRFDLNCAMSHAGLTYQPSSYYCEQLFDSFFLETQIKGN